MNEEKEKNITKYEFIRLLAKRANFTIKDTYEFWDEVEGIFEDCIREEVPLDIKGFGHLYVKKVKAREGHNVLEDRPQNYKESGRIVFRWSRNMKNILRNRGKVKINEKELRQRKENILESLSSLE